MSSLRAGRGQTGFSLKMGNQLSRDEQMIVSAMRNLIIPLRLGVSDEALCDLLAWAKNHSFVVDLGAAFDSETWECLGDCLLAAVTTGDAVARTLLPPWRCISKALRLKLLGNGKVTKPTCFLPVMAPGTVS